MSSSSTSRFSFLSQLAASLVLIFSVAACGGGSSDATAVIDDLSKLTVEISGSGQVTGALNCSANCESDFETNAQVELVAQASEGYEFSQWTGACSGSGSCSLVLNSDKVVGAIFVQTTSEPDEYVLTVSLQGQGEVVSTPAGISCGSDCSESYQEQTQVSLQATPASGYQFDGWSGACSGASCSVTMNAARSVTANFSQIVVEPSEYALSVSLSGSGSVSSNPSGISCGSSCNANFDENTQVALTATPDSGFVFQGWSGACSGSGSCNVTMTQDLNVTATFVEESVTEYTLTVSKSGSGDVTSTPSGINCGSDCSEDFAENSQVTLQAVAADGYEFESWSGACSGSGTCNLTMTSNLNVTANFVEEPVTEYQLDVTANGLGTIISTPSGIDCGADCDELFDEDTQVSLTATPQSGYRFERWEGSCTGSNACSVTMDSAKSVTAVFIEDNTPQPDLLIEDYRPQADAFQLGEIPNNASGITWHEELQQYLVVRNNAADIYRYNVNFNYLGQLHVSDINRDTEGLGFINGNEVMVVTENNYAHKLEIDEFTSHINGSPSQTQAYRLLPFGASNKGLEGVAGRKAEGGGLARVYACQEGTGTNSSAHMRVVYFDVPATDPLVLLSYEDNSLEVIEPFDAEQAFAGVVTDIAGMVYDPRTGHLIIVSQESRKAIQVNPDTGEVISQLSLSGAPQFEGVTIGPNGELVFVSEGNWIRIYELP